MIYSGIYRSPIGPILIKISDDHICELTYIDGDASAGFENSTMAMKSKNVWQQCTTQLDEFFSGSRKKFDLPLQQEGTNFQQRVWNELLDIPYGSTINYRQLAQRLGDVKSIRAAASANGRNKLNIVIPCHRVIGSDGSLTGYSGGLSRKKWLLDHENKFTNGVSLLF